MAVGKRAKHVFPRPGTRQTGTVRRARKDGDHQRAPDGRKKRKFENFEKFAKLSEKSEIRKTLKKSNKVWVRRNENT